MDKESFSKRLTQLRMNKGVSARDMSLSIGQSPSYINNIENGVNLPSMMGFFYICEYLSVSPRDFFDEDTQNPPKVQELVAEVKSMRTEQLDTLIALIRSLRGST